MPIPFIRELHTKIDTALVSAGKICNVSHPLVHLTQTAGAQNERANRALEGKKRNL